VLEILTYYSTLRFLRAVRVQTAFNDYAYWDRLIGYKPHNDKPRDLAGVCLRALHSYQWN